MTYAFNGDGLCVRQDDGVVDLETLYDGLNRVLEEDGGTVEADYTTTPEPYGNALSQHRSGDSSFYLWDGIRNVRQLTDGAEVVTDSYGFDGWGRSTGSSGSTANTQQWQGQSIAYRKDADAGPESQYAMHHRNYNPRSGVFTAADPAKDDLNLYRYVHNNPVNRDDPSGLFALPDDSGPTLLELQEKFARTKAQLQKANEALEEESQKCFLTHSEQRANELFAHSDYLRRRLWEIRDEIQQKHDVAVSTRERINRPETELDWSGFSEGWKRSWTLNPQASVDGIDTALKIGQWTAAAVGVVAGSVVAVKGLLVAGAAAAPVATSAVASTKATTAAAVSLIKYNAIQALTGTSIFVINQAQNIQIFVTENGQRLHYFAQRGADFFNQRPFWRDRLLDGLESAAQVNSVEEMPEAAARGAALGWALDAAPGAPASLKYATRDALRQCLDPRSVTLGMGLGFLSGPSMRKPTVPDLPDCSCDPPPRSTVAKPDALDEVVPEPKPSSSKPVQPETSLTPELPEGSIIAPSRNTQVAIRHREGNQQIIVDGQRWHIPKGKSEASIPATDPVGDRLEALAAQHAKEWNTSKLTAPQARAIQEQIDAGRPYVAKIYEARYRGSWVEDRVRESAMSELPDLKWYERGVDVVDPKTGLRYDILSGSYGNMTEHAQRMSNEVFRMIPFPTK